MDWFKQFDEVDRVPLSPELLNGELLRAVGRVSVAFVELETVLGTGVKILLQATGSGGEVILSQLSFKQRVEVFGALYREKFPDEEVRSRLEHFIKRAILAEQERNTLLHGHWLMPASDNRAVHVKAQRNLCKGLKVKIDAKGPIEVNATADAIRRTTAALNILLSPYMAGI